MLDIYKNRKFIIVIAIVVSIMGIWYALPQTGLVFDEFFPGGVLRSISNHSIFPQGQDILYGTITFYLDYIFIAVLLLFLFPFANFHISTMKSLMLQNIHLAYLTSRIVSAFAFVLCVYIFYKICEYEKLDIKSALYSILLVFGSTIFVTTFHTAKVWPISILLLLTSIFYLYRFIKDKTSKNAFLTILFSFLAFANFPVMGFGLISILILLYHSDLNKDNFKKIFAYILISFIIFVIISLINKAGIYAQIHSILYDYTLSSKAISTNLSIFESLILNIIKSFNLYALIFISFIIAIFSKSKIRSKELFSIGLIYLIVYVICISVVARWSTDIYTYLRYLIPVGIFLGLILISLDFRINKFNILVSIIALAYLLKILVLLSVPTTGNLAYNSIKRNMNSENILINREDLSNVQLPMNKSSALLIDEQFCGTICNAYISDIIVSDFKSVVITEQVNKEKNIKNNEKVYERYLMSNSLKNNLYKKIISFENGNNSLAYIPDIEQIGNYFDFGIFSLNRLGSNIYIYKLP